MAKAKLKTRSKSIKSVKATSIKRKGVVKKAKKVRTKHDLKAIAKKANELKDLIVDGAKDISSHVIRLKDLTLDVKDSFYDLKDTILDLKKEAINTRDDLGDISYDLKKQTATTASEVKYGLRKLSKKALHLQEGAAEKIGEYKKIAVKKGRKIVKSVIPTEAIKAISIPQARKSLKKLTKIISKTAANTFGSSSAKNKSTKSAKSKRKITKATKKNSIAKRTISLVSTRKIAKKRLYRAA